MIFSRGRQGGRHAARAAEPATETVEVEVPSVGPYDVSDAPRRACSGSTWAACRSRRCPASRCGCRPTRTASIQQVVLVSGESALQLGVFAAPRYRGDLGRGARRDPRSRCWPTARSSTRPRASTAPSCSPRRRAPDGADPSCGSSASTARAGWSAAVFQGPAAVDPARPRPLTECLDGLVVDRGQEAHAGARAAAAAAAPGRRPPSADDRRRGLSQTARARRGSAPGPAAGAGRPAPAATGAAVATTSRGGRAGVRWRHGCAGGARRGPAMPVAEG